MSRLELSIEEKSALLSQLDMNPEDLVQTISPIEQHAVDFIRCLDDKVSEGNISSQEQREGARMITDILSWHSSDIKSNGFVPLRELHPSESASDQFVDDLALKFLSDYLVDTKAEEQDSNTKWFEFMQIRRKDDIHCVQVVREQLGSSVKYTLFAEYIDIIQEELSDDQKSILEKINFGAAVMNIAAASAVGAQMTMDAAKFVGSSIFSRKEE